MKSSAKLEVQLLTDALVKAGITDVVLSPGSRNAPLMIAFDEHPELRTWIIADERSAAFYAIGMAQQQQRAVAIACTSGSAPLNYFPAVAEAYYQGIPLVVITADRPEEWVDQGDGQTIVQQNAYGTHVLASAQLSEIFSDSQRWMFERKCSETIQRASHDRKGPVHLNVPFTEPLYSVSDQPERLKQWIELGNPLKTPDEKGQGILHELWTGSSKIMILAGQNIPSPRTNDLLQRLSEQENVIVLTEHTSNVHGEKFVDCIDRTLNQLEDAAPFQPNLLVSIGGAVVSKRIKAFLRQSPGLKTIRVAPDFPFMDTYQSLQYYTDAEAGEVLDYLLGLPEKPSDFAALWQERSAEARKQHQAQLEETEFSDLAVMNAVLKSVPDGAYVHFSNSAVIRYGLLFDNRPQLTYWCNRGTSGIDGSTSTACGAALASPDKLHVLVSGDMSFFYDSNAFWNQHLPANLKIVLINNGGGDIFNIIPGPKSVSQHLRYFVAEQHYSAKGICESYKVNYRLFSAEEQLDAAVSQLMKTDGLTVLEIDTSSVKNSEILEEYWKKSRK